MKFCRNKLVPEYITGKQELSKEDVVRLLQESEIFLPKYNTNEDYFYGKHKILDRYFDDPSKPNNQVMCNIPKYIVQVRTGFFSSSPLTMESRNEEYMNDIRDILEILAGILVISYFLIHVLLWATLLWMFIDLFIGGKK